VLKAICSVTYWCRIISTLKLLRMGNRCFGLGIETMLVEQVAIKVILDGDPVVLEERVTSI